MSTVHFTEAVVAWNHSVNEKESTIIVILNKFRGVSKMVLNV